MKKKFIFLLVSLLVLGSCSERLGPEEEKYVQFTISVQLDTTGASTRTSMEDNETVGKIVWSSGDYLILYNTESFFTPGIKSQSVSNISNDGTKAVFTFLIQEYWAKELENKDSYLFYGDESLVKFGVGGYGPFFSLNVPANQTHAGSACFQEFENVAFGFCPKGTFKYDSATVKPVVASGCVLRNAFGVLKVPIALKEGDVSNVRYVRLTDKTEGQYLAGTFDVIVSTSGETLGVPTLTHKAGSGGESRTIEKYIPKTAKLSKTNPYVYFIVPPGTLFGSNGLGIAVYTDDGYYGSKTLTPKSGSGVAVVRSKITQLNISLFTPKPIPEPEPLSANSFIFNSDAGLATFPAHYQGNGFQGNGGDVAALSHEIEFNSNYYAEIIWQTKCNGETILAAEVVDSPVYFQSPTTGRPCISFHKSGVPGNALIALRNPNSKVKVQQLGGGEKYVDEILWSWHVWIADDATTLQNGIKMYKGSEEIFTIMDRNLGALYFNPRQGSQSHGLGYQYGRKDPFMQSRITSGQSDVAYASYASLYPATGIYTIEESTYGIAGSVQFPYIRLMNTNQSWCSQNVEWGDPGCVMSKHTNKSLYDPCPVGWRVLEEANLATLWGIKQDSTFVKPVGTVYSVDSSTGKAFSLKNGNGTRVEFPAAGYALSQTNVSDIGTNVFLWGSTTDNGITSEGVRVQAIALDFVLKQVGNDETSGYEMSTIKINKKTTMPVRCQKWNEPIPTGNTPTYEEDSEVIVL